MYFLRKLNDFNIDKTLCTLFYKSVIESIITFCIIVWAGNATSSSTKHIERTIRKASRFTNDISNLPTLFDNYCSKRLHSIMKDSTHPLFGHIKHSKRTARLFSIRTKTTRHFNSFLPHSVRLFNSSIKR